MYSGGLFGDTDSPVFMDSVQCQGSEERLIDCNLDGGMEVGQRDDTCGQDLGVKCPGIIYECMYIVCAYILP